MNKGIKIEELLITQKLKINDQIWKAKPFKGAEDLINFCINTKLPIALVTSSSSQSFKLKSNANPWLNLFKVKIFGDDKYIKSESNKGNMGKKLMAIVAEGTNKVRNKAKVKIKK